VSDVHQIGKAARRGPRKPSIRDIDLAGLASIADALAASGRGDLAAHIVEILYYCGERRTHTERVIAFSQHVQSRRYRLLHA
jgi:hypothetical protein